MSSLLKPSTRSLSTFRPQSLFASVAPSLPPTLSFSLTASLSLYALASVSLLHTDTHTHTLTQTQSVYCSLSLLSPPTHKYVQTCTCTRACSESAHSIFKPLSPSSLLTVVTRSLNRNKELYECQLALSNSVVSLNPKFIKSRSVRAHHSTKQISKLTVEQTQSIST